MVLKSLLHNNIIMNITETQKTFYKHKNRFITQQVVWVVTGRMEASSTHFCAKVTNNIGCSRNAAKLDSGIWATVGDLVCMYGLGKAAREVAPLWFYGGPQVDIVGEPFALLEGSLSHWVSDMLLFHVSRFGIDILTELDFWR